MAFPDQHECHSLPDLREWLNLAPIPGFICWHRPLDYRSQLAINQISQLLGVLVWLVSRTLNWAWGIAQLSRRTLLRAHPKGHELVGTEYRL